MSDWYEPWQPAIGDRVRVRLSAECQFWSHTHGDGDALGYEDGATGTVTRRVPLDLNAGHGYEVIFDDPKPHPPGQAFPQLIGSVYAAIELEPQS